MQRQMIQVPQSFRAFGRWQREGEAGVRWLAALPAIVAEQCARWGLCLDGEPMHGDNGLAIPVLRDDEPLVLKVSWPDHLVAEQVQALRFWDGQGTVQLFEADPATGVLLLERLDAGHALRDVPLGQAISIIGALLRRLAIPAPRSHHYRTTAGVAAELHEALWSRWDATGRPFTPAALDAAVALARDLSTGAPAVMVDSDLHYEQVLGGQRESWLVIDPLVLVGDIEYQCAQLLWTRFDEIDDGARLRWCLDALIDAAALDPVRAHAWAILRAVDYWLWGLAVGFTEDPVRCQRIVETLL